MSEWVSACVCENACICHSAGGRGGTHDHYRHISVANLHPEHHPFKWNAKYKFNFQHQKYNQSPAPSPPPPPPTHTPNQHHASKLCQHQGSSTHEFWPRNYEMEPPIRLITIRDHRPNKSLVWKPQVHPSWYQSTSLGRQQCRKFTETAGPMVGMVIMSGSLREVTMKSTHGD